MSSLQQKIDLARVVSYTPPRLYVGKEWYVGWYSFCPIEQKLKRKKVKLNHITNKNERRKYANDLIVCVNEQLRKGWNPFIASENSKSYSTESLNLNTLNLNFAISAFGALLFDVCDVATANLAKRFFYFRMPRSRHITLFDGNRTLWT